MEIEYPNGQWGKLISLNQNKYPDLPLKQNQIQMGRVPSNTFHLTDLRLSGVHCEILKQDQLVTLFDKSSNGTFLQGEKIGKGKAKQLKHGDEITLLREGPKVKKDEIIAYRYHDINKILQEQKQKRVEQEFQEKLERQKKQQQIMEQQQQRAQQLALENKKKLEEEQKQIQLQKMKQQKELEQAQQKMQLEQQKQLEEMKKKMEQEMKQQMEEQKKQHEEQMEKIKQSALLESQKLKEEQQKQQQEDDNFVEDFECCICMEIIYQCVTLNPCLHNMCGACASDWLQKKDQCPTCNNKVDKVRKNPTLNNIIEKYLQKHEDKKWMKEITDVMDKKNRIHKVEMTVKEIVEYVPQVPQQIKKPPPPIVNAPILLNSISSSDSEEEALFQAAAPIQKKPIQKRGRKSKNSQQQSQDNSQGLFAVARPIKAQCSNCNKKFTQNVERDQCIICNQFYCNLYKPCTGRSQLKKLQKVNNFKAPARLNQDIFKGNKTEVDVLSKYLIDNKLTTQCVFNFMKDKYISKELFFYQLNPKIHNSYGILNRNIKIQLNNSVCTGCFSDVWFQILFRYREEIKQDLEFPYNFTEQCPYGLNCRTMAHNKDHEQQFDHICEQTKFN